MEAHIVEKAIIFILTLLVCVSVVTDIYTIFDKRRRQNQSLSKLAVNHRAGLGNRTTTIASSDTRHTAPRQ